MVQYPRTSVINHLHTDSYWVICVVSLDHGNVVLKPLECWKHLNHIPFVNKICKEIGHTSKYMAHDHALLYVYNAYQDTKFSQPATKYPYSDNNYPPPLDKTTPTPSCTEITSSMRPYKQVYGVLCGPGIRSLEEFQEGCLRNCIKWNIQFNLIKIRS